MKQQLAQFEELVIRFWSDTPQLIEGLAGHCLSQLDQAVVLSDSALTVQCERAKLPVLVYGVSQLLRRDLWSNIFVEFHSLEGECLTRVKYNLGDLYQQYVMPDLMKAFSNWEVNCFRQPMVKAGSHTVVAEEFSLRVATNDLVFDARKLFEFADRVGLHQDLHWQAIERCLPHCFALRDKSRAFINIDPAHYHETPYAWEEILEATAENAYEDNSIVFEISMIGQGDCGMMSNFAKQVRSRGFQVALDNWGSHENTLETLECVRPDFLKFDEKTLSGPRDRYQQKLVTGMVQLAEELEIVTVAEGIHGPNDLSFAEDCGFDWLQGDYFGKSAPATITNASNRRLPEVYGASVVKKSLMGKC